MREIVEEIGVVWGDEVIVLMPREISRHRIKLWAYVPASSLHPLMLVPQIVTQRLVDAGRTDGGV